MNEFYKKNGYLLVKKFANVSFIRNQIYKIFTDYSKNTPKDPDDAIISLFKEDFDSFIGCANACQSLLSIMQLSTNYQMMLSLNDLGLDNPIINTRPCVSFSSRKTAKKEHYWKTPPHQDWPSTQGSLNGLTCWIPLVNVTPELGPLEVSPKTHLLGPLPWDEKGPPIILTTNSKFEFKPVPMSAGDAIFFSNFLIHRSGNNSTENKIRISMHFRYDDASESVFKKRKYPKHKIEVRADGNILNPFPMRDLLSIFK